MIKKKQFSSAFTLIELLVVITIIGILAGIALPVFNQVQIKGAQTKVLAQAKQVGLALKLYAGDNNGTYPVYVAGTATAPNTGAGTAAAGGSSNKDFFPLFPTYCQSEAIFANKYNYYNNKVPDNVIDAAGALSPTNTLKAGENAFAYIEGLSDSFNPGCPLIFDAPNGTKQYVSTPNTAGFCWGMNKAVVVHLDNSASLDTLAASGASGTVTWTDTQTIPGGTSTTAVNILDPVANTSLNGCFISNPDRGQ